MNQLSSREVVLKPRPGYSSGDSSRHTLYGALQSEDTRESASTHMQGRSQGVKRNVPPVEPDSDIVDPERFEMWKFKRTLDAQSKTPKDRWQKEPSEPFRRGMCPMGKKECAFSHDANVLREKKRPICRFVTQGLCRSGKLCFFSHDVICRQFGTFGECHTSGCQFGHVKPKKDTERDLFVTTHLEYLTRLVKIGAAPYGFAKEKNRYSTMWWFRRVNELNGHNAPAGDRPSSSSRSSFSLPEEFGGTGETVDSQ